jgi:mannan endo-1,4-beta-mannosidase
MLLSVWQEKKLHHSNPIMKITRKTILSFSTILGLNCPLLVSQPFNPEPVSPGSSTEAKALLQLLYNISGHYILTGQHNYPNIRDRNTRFAARYIGKTPVVFSTDWGFAGDGDTDSYLARPDIVNEAIRQHKLGSIITICWHAVPPTADEPVTFRPLPGTSADSLASVQGQLLDRQFIDLLTPGTVLYKRWCMQVDSVAKYLKKLEEAHVPVLWRPYHEMNGDWFWWGGHVGRYSTTALYRQLFDRLVNHHRLTNLIWIWSVDRPNKPEMQFHAFYPGSQYLDVLALDVYRNDFSKTYYDSLLALSAGKPVVLAEVGNPPSPGILKDQPGWGYYVIWAGMVRNTTRKQYQDITSDARFLSLEDSMYRALNAPYRIACGLAPLPFPVKTPADFSGEWTLNEEKSYFDNAGASSFPYKMTIAQKDHELNITRTVVLEFADDRITNERLIADGSEQDSEFMGFPRVTTALCTKDMDTLIIDSKITMQRGDRTFESITREIWTLQKQGTILTIQQYSSSPWGERNVRMVFDRR